MIEFKNDFIKKFEYGDYLVYIKDCGSHYESYLQHKEYGVMELMFGLDKAKGRITLQNYIDTINANIIDYIVDYKNEYED